MVAWWHGGMMAPLLRVIGASCFYGSSSRYCGAGKQIKVANPPGITQYSLMDSTTADEILCIALSRDGKIVASLSQNGWIHIWNAPQDVKLKKKLGNANALRKVNIITSDKVAKALTSNKVTKSITVANSDDVCAVSFVSSTETESDCLGKEIVEGHIGPALQRAFKRAFKRPNIEPDNTNSGLCPIIIQFPAPGGEDPSDTSDYPNTPDYNQAEEGKSYPLPKHKFQQIQHLNSTVFFDVDTLFKSESIFVCCPPYIHVYRRSDFNTIRTIYFNILDIMQPLDNDLNVSDLHSKTNRFALMYQSIPQFNQESYKLRKAMLLNIGAIDVRWERRFALSSDGSRLAVLSNVDAKGVPSQYITVHILLMNTGLEVIRWRAEITPSKVCFHDSGDKLYIITKEQQILLYDVNTAKIITQSIKSTGNHLCLHSTRHYYFKPANNAIEVETLVPTPMDEGKIIELKPMGDEPKILFQGNQWILETVQESEQWVCCIKNNSNDSETKRFSFQPVGINVGDDEHGYSLNNKFSFAVTETGAVLVVTSVTVQLWSPAVGANYTLCDFWCISKIGRSRKKYPTVIDLEWDGMKVETIAKDKMRIILCIKEDEESNSKGYYEIVMKNSNDSDASDSSVPNTPKVEEQMAFSCCCYLMLLSRMINEERCDWKPSPREIEKIPELTVEIKEMLQQYIPTYRYPRIYIRYITHPILYLFNFEDLDAVFTEYRNYSRCIFAWIYESDETPENFFSYVNDNVVQAKVVRWLIRKIQRGETAYGLLLQKWLPTLMRNKPELASEIARGLSYQICVAPIVDVEKPGFLRQERWPAKKPVFPRQERWPAEINNLDMEILTKFNHLDPIIQFTDHVDFPDPDSFKFVWLAIASRCRFLTRLGQLKQCILQYYPNFSPRWRSGFICVVPLLGLCSYDDTGKSTFTEIVEVTLERNFVEIAEPFLEAVVNHATSPGIPSYLVELFGTLRIHHPHLVRVLVPAKLSRAAWSSFSQRTSYLVPTITPEGVVEGTIDNTVANLSLIPIDSNGQNYTQDFTTVMINVFFFTTQNYSTMATFAPNVTLLLILFAALIGILLFNVLIALLNNVYTNALESGQRLWLLLFIQIVADIEVLPFLSAHDRTRTDWFPPYIYYIAYDSEIKAYEKVIAPDDDRVRRQRLKWGPDQQFSDVWENIPDVVEALFNYNPQGKKNHLSLKRGETIDVIRAFSSGWWYGKRGKEKGLFPCNFVGPYAAKRQSQSTMGNAGYNISNASLNTMVSLDATPELNVQYGGGRLWFPSEGPLPTPRNDV
ncbi:hypothetical protein BC937DRAFT_87543 [Endogone sp. FLAS-F59071]|nr:hypothetical protein BC937DRAFT_87543 [Endogone sp. FLAS-F59071]|eukprot:RUS22732.1 hypothetical protein BC937DRAFT_87543 [Endogone sp. FLAS-F59071]